ncbi:MFS transporter [Mediterraneibacter glycyrrhizinilyticus]|uniref:MFS transporter n=1 Tax=Mediterraneibacter glycyrrhizinilyticus TaxID=342942 RepID=UPI00189D5ED6|nr:glycoside-pentoside-hexuronide (GPH):cation symporter [Mediterraneibacter glycyrrhizinilyticus]
MATNTKKFGMVDKLGYMFGDFGNDLTFILSSMMLMKFYSDVMGVSVALVGTMMMVARFVDAFTDVAMGQIVDRSRPGKKGKFLPWIRRMCGPVAVASFLMYASWFQDMSMGFKIGWMFVTYLLWGSVFYTSINIPYGSMASALSADPKERAQLSSFRTIGATIAGSVIGIVLPLIVYYQDEAGNQILSGPKTTLAAGIFSVGAVICYLLCYFMSTERVKVEQKTEKFNFKELVKGLVTNKALVGIVICSILMLLVQLTMQSMSTYVYPNYFGNVQAQSVAGVVGLVMTLLLSTVVVKLQVKMGRKELAIAGSLFGAVIFFITWLTHTKNAWLYVGLYALAYLGLAAFSLICWAMITDVIDDTEVRTGERSDGTIYAVYSFARKLGQAASAGVTGALLGLIGYSAETAFEPAVTEGIFNLACLIPTGGFILLAAALWFFYPLNKKRVEDNAKFLAEKAEKAGK